MGEVRKCKLGDVVGLCRQYHGYGGAGGRATYSFGYYEQDRLVAAFSWQPPPPGAAKAVCPEAPHAVLALSRMVAVPKDQRELVHISQPLSVQMFKLIDRTRYPVLVTYHDEGQGHTGTVYRASNWERGPTTTRAVYRDENGVRKSCYVGGLSFKNPNRNVLLIKDAKNTALVRWEQWVCSRGQAAVWMAEHGWIRVPLLKRDGTPKVWASGNPAFTYKKVSGC